MDLLLESYVTFDMHIFHQKITFAWHCKILKSFCPYGKRYRTTSGKREASSDSEVSQPTLITVIRGKTPKGFPVTEINTPSFQQSLRQSSYYIQNLKAGSGTTKCALSSLVCIGF